MQIRRSDNSPLGSSGTLKYHPESIQSRIRPKPKHTTRSDGRDGSVKVPATRLCTHVTHLTYTTQRNAVVLKTVVCRFAFGRIDRPAWDRFVLIYCWSRTYSVNTTENSRIPLRAVSPACHLIGKPCAHFTHHISLTIDWNSEHGIRLTRGKRM